MHLTGRIKLHEGDGEKKKDIYRQAVLFGNSS